MCLLSMNVERKIYLTDLIEEMTFIVIITFLKDAFQFIIINSVNDSLNQTSQETGKIGSDAPKIGYARF